jgi:hypothetical protein
VYPVQVTEAIPAFGPTPAPAVCAAAVAVATPAVVDTLHDASLAVAVTEAAPAAALVKVPVWTVAL